MRVAELQASLPPSPHAGGVGYQVDLLAMALANRGHAVTAFVVDDAPEGVPYRCIEVAAGRGRMRRLLGVGWSFARLDPSDTTWCTPTETTGCSAGGVASSERHVSVTPPGVSGWRR